jgi:hypothetical protein
VAHHEIGKLADPQFRHDRARKASLSRTTTESHLAKVVSKATEAAEVDSVDEWAQRVAASLPPMTAREIAALGKLTAALDARRAAGGDPVDAAT